MDAAELARVRVFASSLLSLISPWGHSRVARCPPSRTRCPQQVAPPPPPRRHSDPARPTREPKPKHRRYSETKNTKSKPDLRQELLNLNLERQEFDSWLGKKFEEVEEYDNDDRFAHDIPLQRTISLDRGIDIFNHLQAIGSWADSATNSTWSINSDRDSLTFEQYRSFEDIPASPFRVKSRRASSGVDNAFSERNLALSVLRESYKGLDSGSLSPQIRKLHRCFTYAGSISNAEKENNSLESYQEDVRKPPKLTVDLPSSIGSNSCPVSPRMKKLASFTFSKPNSIENIDDIDRGLEIRHPVYRSISMGSTKDSEFKPRQRRSGLQGIFAKREETNLRKGVLLKQIEYKSCENIIRGGQKSRRSSLDAKGNQIRNALIRGSYKNVNFDGSLRDILTKLKTSKEKATRMVPAIIISHVRDSNDVPTSSSEVRCNCRICTDNEDGFIRNALSRLFLKIMTCMEYGRKYWDENNNLNESEMYKCLMHVLKLLVGLWLRHLDHN